MATGFSEDEGKCQGLGCKTFSRVTYNVKEKKKLCDDCATKTGSISKVRKNASKLTCDQHDKPMRLYCQTHSIALCNLCALKEHQKPCQLEDIDVVFKEKREKLYYSKEKATTKKLYWKDHGIQLAECRQESERHFEAVTNEVNSVFNDTINMIKENEEKSAKIINDEADKEIQQITQEINVKREACLEKCHKGAERESKQLESRRNELLDDVTAISNKIQTKLDALQTKATCIRDVIQAIDDAAQRTETLLEDDEDLLNGAQQLITSLTDTLKKTVEEGVVKDITHTVNSVRFIRGVGKEKYNGRIVHDGKWELSGSVGIPDELISPCIVGCINGDEIIIFEILSEFHTYVINLCKGTTTKVIAWNGKSRIGSCALLDENTIVCGKYMYMRGCSGNSLRGCISLYDRQWNLIRDITIPRNQKHDYTSVNIAVDHDRMIIAAEWNQPYIYIINPADGRIVNKITCTGNIKLCGVLSSGDIVALPHQFTNKVLIIDRQGTQREIKCKNEILNCSIDPLTDDLYTLSWDENQKVVVVHHMSSSGQQEEKQLLTYQIDNNDCCHEFVVKGFIAKNQLKMSKSGKVIICNGRECFIYK